MHVYAKLCMWQGPGFVQHGVVLAAAVLSAEVNKLREAVEVSTAAHKEAAAALEAKRARLRECDSEIRGLEKERQKLLRDVQDVEVEKKRKDNRSAGVAIVGQIIRHTW